MNSFRIATLSGVFLLLGWVTPTQAQTYGPPGAAVAGQVGTSGVDAYPGDGIRLSESALLHVGVTAEAGYDTNVFYENDNAPSSAASSAVLVVSPFFDLSNSLRQNSNISQSFTYHLGASLAYRQYLDNDPNVKAQTHFSPTASGGITVTGAKSSLAISDTFTRIQEPPYGGVTDSMDDRPDTIKRDHNTGSVQVGFTPGGGRIATTLRYTNRLELFEQASETDLSWGNNMAHEGLLDVSWKWLPKTALFLRMNGGYVHYLNPERNPANRRVDSIPVSAGLGIRGLITPKLSASVDVGYGTAFYPDKNLTVSGGNTIQGAVSVAYRLGYSTALNLGYMHGFRNSPLVGDYYNVDGVQLGASQSIGGRLVTSIDGRYEFRRYQNVQFAAGSLGTRKDHLVVGQAKADFFIQKWLYAGVGYTVTLNRSDLDDTINGGPMMGRATIQGIDYTKQQILGRLGVTY